MDWLLWIDIETDGLKPDENNILQIACILTDFNLEIEHYLGEFTIGYSATNLNLSEWCKIQHGESGLLEKVYKSELKLHDVESTIVSNLNCYVGLKDTVHIAGNSVYFDKSFIDKYMPNLSKRLNRRIVDVSTISILCKNLRKHIYDNKPIKNNQHTALFDIQESIEEMRYYMSSKFLGN